MIRRAIRLCANALAESRIEINDLPSIRRKAWLRIDLWRRAEEQAVSWGSRYRRSRVGERQYSDAELYRRLLAQARPYWRCIAGFLILDLLGAPLHLLLPVPLKIIVDSVIGNHPLPTFLVYVLPESI